MYMDNIDKTVKDCQYMARNYRQLGYSRDYVEHNISERIIFSDDPGQVSRLYDILDEFK